jgi:hypothetical protein
VNINRMQPGGFIAEHDIKKLKVEN